MTSPSTPQGRLIGLEAARRRALERSSEPEQEREDRGQNVPWVNPEREPGREDRGQNVPWVHPEREREDRGQNVPWVHPENSGLVDARSRVIKKRGR